MNESLSKLQDRVVRLKHHDQEDWYELCDLLEDLIYEMDDMYEEIRKDSL